MEDVALQTLAAEPINYEVSTAIIRSKLSTLC